jgi:hypothetical protein
MINQEGLSFPDWQKCVGIVQVCGECKKCNCGAETVIGKASRLAQPASATVKQTKPAKPTGVISVGLHKLPQSTAAEFFSGGEANPVPENHYFPVPIPSREAIRGRTEELDLAGRVAGKQNRAGSDEH